MHATSIKPNIIVYETLYNRKLHIALKTILTDIGKHDIMII